MVDSLRSHPGIVVWLFAAHAVSQTAVAGVAAPIAANGRLEGASSTVALAFAQSGRIDTIRVDEGDFVRRGQPLAALDCSALQAERRMAAAGVEIARRGERAEAVAAQHAEVLAIEAEKNRYEAQSRRIAALAASSLAAKASLEDAELLLKYTEARRQVAAMTLLRMRNPQPVQEREVASAKADALDAQLQECTLKAPRDGVVLRRLVEPGAVVSAVFPEPVIMFADTRVWQVRAEVDEADAGRVHVGQQATVTAPAFGTTEVKGTVVRVSPVMGRRTVLSGDPAEKMDRDVREVLLRLDTKPPVPTVGLRIKVRFMD